MAGGPSLQGTEIHDIESKTYIRTAHNVAAKVQHSNTTFNYNNTDVDMNIRFMTI